MATTFDKTINGVTYSFYRIPFKGETYYGVGFLKEGKREVFILHKDAEGKWKPQPQEWPQDLAQAEQELNEAIAEREKQA